MQRRAFCLAFALQEEAFKDAVKEWIDRADWFSYVQGKARCVLRRHAARLSVLAACSASLLC